MTPDRRRMAGLALLGLALAGAIALLAGWSPLSRQQLSQPRPSPSEHAAASAPGAERPELLLLTSLPILFDEGFSLGGGSPAGAALERDFALVPIAAAEPRLLEGHRRLLMAHPRAQPAELLVALDAWVRAGGQLWLLADPRLEWESAKPLGDLTRPPPAFADTGLLAHWGLALDDLSASRGRLRAEAAEGARCTLDDGGFIAHCRIGAGQVTVIADADLMFEPEGIALLLGELRRPIPR